MSTGVGKGEATDHDGLIGGACLLLTAIGHKSRMKVLLALADGPLSVTELTHRLGMRQAATSQHLARLRRTGILATTRNGRSVIYRIADDRVPGIMVAALQLRAH